MYYRVNTARAAQAARHVDALQRALAPLCSTLPRRMSRCDDADTWMEVYEGIADWPAFEAGLARGAERLVAAGLIDGSRHLECFTPAKSGN